MIRRLGLALYFLLFSLPTFAHAIGPAAATLVVGLVAAGISALGSIMSSNSADDAIEAQAEENEKSRILEAKLTREQLKEAKRQFDLELGQQKEELKSTKQQRAIENSQVIAGKFMNAMNTNHATAKSFYEMADRKRNRLANKSNPPSGPIGEIA